MMEISSRRANTAIRTAVAITMAATAANAPPMIPAAPPAIRRSDTILSSQSRPKRTSSTNGYAASPFATRSTEPGSREPGFSRSSSEAGSGLVSRSVNTSRNSSISCRAVASASVLDT
jgi:hypothetical protein